VFTWSADARIRRSGGHLALLPGRHGECEVKTLRITLGCDAGKTTFSPVGSLLPRARFQTAAFLQQVPKTSESGPNRPGTPGSFSLPN